MSLADATDDGSDFSEAAAEPRESEEFWPPHETEHRLPSNAVSFPGSSWQDHYRPSSFSASGDERASLLHSDSQPSATAPSASLSTSPPEDVPFARRARSFQRPTANPKEDTSSIANIPGGSSSDAATMFNMVNSLVGISLLALRAFCLKTPHSLAKQQSVHSQSRHPRWLVLRHRLLHICQLDHMLHRQADVSGHPQEPRPYQLYRHRRARVGCQKQGLGQPHHFD